MKKEMKMMAMYHRVDGGRSLGRNGKIRYPAGG